MRRFVLLAAITLSVAMPAAAQTRRDTHRRVPDTGMLAVGVMVGASVTSDDFLGNGLNLPAQIEGYVTPRVSIRGQVSGAWWDISGHSFIGTVRPVAFNGNVVYNWERGVWHPYATGGVGLYHYRFTEGTLKSSDTKFGADFGGGVEYFLTRRDTVTGEVLVHAVPGDASGRFTTINTSYWTLAAGYKKYF